MANKIQKLTQSRATVQRILNESDGLRQQVESELATLKGEGEGSVSAAVEAGVRRVLGGASEAYDTLKEIEEYIEKDEAGAVALAQSIAKIPFEKGSADNSAVLKNTSKKNQATYQGAMAVGEGCKAQAQCSNAEGFYTEANGFASHAEGSHTITNNSAEHAEGYWNKSKWGGVDVDGTIHSVGIGTSEDDRKNAHEILRSGKHFVLGIGGYDGTNPTESEDLATIINKQHPLLTFGDNDIANSKSSLNFIHSLIKLNNLAPYTQGWGNFTCKDDLGFSGTYTILSVGIANSKANAILKVVGSILGSGFNSYLVQVSFSIAANGNYSNLEVTATEEFNSTKVLNRITELENIINQITIKVDE